MQHVCALTLESIYICIFIALKLQTYKFVTVWKCSISPLISCRTAEFMVVAPPWDAHILTMCHSVVHLFSLLRPLHVSFSWVQLIANIFFMVCKSCRCDSQHFSWIWTQFGCSAVIGLCTCCFSFCPGSSWASWATGATRHKGKVFSISLVCVCICNYSCIANLVEIVYMKIFSQGDRGLPGLPGLDGERVSL